ncbi:MAG TPA: hypothetical protein VN374_05195 [Desulfitobacteriaceae bacterium]|nr:hypothetical protein [Desulfitobacteriaceae bacterium]
MQLAVMSCCNRQWIKRMHTITNDGQFLKVLLDGKFNEKELLVTQKELMSHPEYAFKNSMWIFSNAFQPVLSPTSIDLLIERIKLLFPEVAKKDKAALVSCSNTQNAILQVICSKFDAASVPFKFRAFQDYHEAVSWLTNN